MIDEEDQKRKRLERIKAWEQQDSLLKSLSKSSDTNVEDPNSLLGKSCANVDSLVSSDSSNNLDSSSDLISLNDHQVDSSQDVNNSGPLSDSTNDPSSELVSNECKRWSLDDDGDDTATYDYVEALPPVDSSEFVLRSMTPPDQPSLPVTSIVLNETKNNLEDEIDPLDAFMMNLEGSYPQSMSNNQSNQVDEAGDDDEIAADMGWRNDSVNVFGSNSTISYDDIMNFFEDAPSNKGSEQEEEDIDPKEEEERQQLIKAALARDVNNPNHEQNADSDLGVILASEGDVVDEEKVIENKKSALDILDEQAKSKQLRPIDHSKVDYAPFRKNLYVVPKVLSRLSQDEVAQKRAGLHILVRGKACPPPVDTWEQCGLSERILQILEKNGLSAPFAIQSQAVPAIMCGRDVIGVAKTGSGKTLAFLLPLFRHIQDQPPLRDGDGPIGLILAPSRELSFQIHIEAKRFTKALGLRVTCIYGGASFVEQIADLKRGVEIAVCTPGRLIDLLTMQAGKMISLKRVTYLVMDEADRMFDMGFGPQIQSIIQNIRPDRQTVLFSATFPKQIEKLAKSVLTYPLEITVGERSTVNKDIEQIVEVIDEDDKFFRLLQILGNCYDRGKVLVFVDKQEKCDQLYQDLLKYGYPCLSLHGGIDQVDRDQTLHDFKSGVANLMVATSVAGRGLDVPEIVCVVNYNCPNHMEDYVHRVGRTGRAGRKGTAFTFITQTEQQYSPFLMHALEKAQVAVPTDLIIMVEGFREKVKAGEAKHHSSGFVGKGFKFNASEKNEAQKMADMQRLAYAIENGLVEDDDRLFDDEDYDNDAAISSSSMNEGQDMMASMLPSSSDPSTASSGLHQPNTPSLVPAKTPVSTPSTLPSSMSAIEKARALASSISQSRVILPPPASGGAIDTHLALARASAIARQISSKDGKAYFSDELDINDYPAQVRILSLLFFLFVFL